MRTVSGKSQHLGGDLLRLAKDPSAEARFVLANSISDLFADHEDDLNEREKRLIDDILGSLVRAFEMDLRRELSRRLAPKANVPRALILMLANDRIEVAAPILTESEILRTPDLVAVIRRHGEAHQTVIAGRETLDEEVSAALVEAGNVGVIETLLRNPGARISEPTMSLLVAEAKWVVRYREPLARRPDLSSEQAGRLYRLVSAVLRQHILANFDIDQQTLDSALEEAVAQTQEENGRASKAASTIPVPTIYGQLADRQEITPELLIRILRRGEISLFRSLFGQWTGLSPRRLDRILREPSGKALAIVCRALTIAKSDFAIILFLTRQTRTSGLVEDPRDVARLIDYFERVPVVQARQRVERWRSRSADEREDRRGDA